MKLLTIDPEKRNAIIIGAIAILIVVTAATIAVKAYASDTSQESKSWIQSIKDSSKSYDAHEAARIDYEKKAEIEKAARDADQGTAEGLRKSLCLKYMITVTESGETLPAKNCFPFL